MSSATDEPASKLPDRLWGKQDLMRFFGVSRATLDGWMRSGRIPRGRRFGRFLRWDPRVIQRLAGLDDHATATEDPQ
jgi:predicted DNA-binding transcriptional regulator AlpA